MPQAVGREWRQTGPLEDAFPGRVVDHKGLARLLADDQIGVALDPGQLLEHAHGEVIEVDELALAGLGLGQDQDPALQAEHRTTSRLAARRCACP